MRRYPREVWAWCTFDIANSSYTTLVVTVAYSVIYAQLVVANGDPARFAEGNAMWSRWLALSWLVAGLIGPFVGALTDRYQCKKRLLTAVVLLCCVFCLGFYVVRPGDWVFAGFLILFSNLFYSMSETALATFLPTLVPKEDLGRVSGLGWSLGYLGGLFSLVFAFLATGFDYRMENYERLRLLGPTTAAFYFIAALPTMIFLKEPRTVAATEDVGVASTWNELRAQPQLLSFLLLYFLIHGGVMIAVSFAAIFGSQVADVVGTEQMIFFLVFQVIAAVGAFSFGKLTSRFGSLRVLRWNLVLWMIAMALMSELPFSTLSPLIGKKVVFYSAGFLAALCLGATLSNSRALVSSMTPEGMGGRILSVWGMVGNAASVFSVFLFGWLQIHFRLTSSLYFVFFLFLVPFVFLSRRKFHDEVRRSF